MIRRTVPAGIGLALMALLAWSGGPALAETAPGDEGRKILEQTADHYAGLKSVSASMEMKIELPKKFAGQMPPMPPVNFDLALEQPNRAALVPAGDSADLRFIQDGKQQYTEVAPLGQYMVGESTTDLAGLANGSMGMVPGVVEVVGFGLPAGASGSLRDAGDVRLLGEEAVGETPCHHLSIGDGPFAGELWIARDGAPWVMRFHGAEPPEAEQGEAPEAGEGGMMIVPRFDYRFSSWQTDPDLTDRFAIAPDASLKKVEQFGPPDGGPGGGPGGGPAEPHASEGKAAPALTIRPVGGDPLELSSLKGKVVVLDFWATWCKPCVMSMPKLAALAAKMAGRDVVFFAVNQGEAGEKVAAFLEKEKLEIPVTLDQKGEGGRAFGVRGIPHLTVIDKDGVVRHVHIGYNPGGADLLERELEALLK